MPWHAGHTARERAAPPGAPDEYARHAGLTRPCHATDGRGHAVPGVGGDDPYSGQATTPDELGVPAGRGAGGARRRRGRLQGRQADVRRRRPVRHGGVEQVLDAAQQPHARVRRRRAPHWAETCHITRDGGDEHPPDDDPDMPCPVRGTGGEHDEGRALPTATPGPRTVRAIRSWRRPGGRTRQACRPAAPSPGPPR